MPVQGFEVIHPIGRLRLCSELRRRGELDFRDLREALVQSNSLVSKHLRTLGDAGIVTTRRETREAGRGRR